MTSSKQYRLSRRSSELANAVPQVIAMRVGRMMGGGLMPSAKDQQEYYRMGAEKVEAFFESWMAMASQASAAQQQFAQWWLQTWWKAAMSGWTNLPTVSHLSTHAGKQVMDSMLDVTMRGMAPVHRRAVDNARRLGKAAR